MTHLNVLQGTVKYSYSYIKNQSQFLKVLPVFSVGNKKQLKVTLPSPLMLFIITDLQAYNEAFDVHDLTRPEDVLHYLKNKSQLQREHGDHFISTELVDKVRGDFDGACFFVF